MQIHVNGEPREVPDGLTLAGLTALMALEGQRFAIEVNEELVPRSRHPEHHLAPGDRVEIVQAIGGG